MFQRRGGKSRNVSFIIERFPKFEYDIYIEPFCGGGSIILKSPEVSKMILSDSDEKVISIYKNIQKVSTNDVKKFDLKCFNKSKFDEIKRSEPILPGAQLEKSLLLICNSYAANSINYSCSKAKSPGKKFKNNIDLYKTILNKYEIFCDDFENIINRYDTERSFVYCDPPYYKTNCESYLHGEINHVRLFDVLKNMKGSFLLSYNDCDFIRNMYYDFKIIVYSAVQTDFVNGGTLRVNELLIMNY